MKRTFKVFMLGMVLGQLPLPGFTQRAEWVEQVIVCNGGKFESSPPYTDYVTVQSYDPVTLASVVFDEIKTQSVQDAVIYDQQFLYVAAQDSIIMYNLNTLQRVNAVSDSGISRLGLYLDKLVVTKQFPITRFFVEILDANNLSLIARIQNISGDCKGVTVWKDTIYVAVNGGFLGTEGKLAVISTGNWQLKREVNFGPNTAEKFTR
jgi:hypothetical protein